MARQFRGIARATLVRALPAALVVLLSVTATAGDLRVGAAAVVITPPEGTRSPATTRRAGRQAVLDDIYCKALVLEQGGDEGGGRGCDLISLPRHTVVEARRLIEQQTGIPGAHVMISATHTHTGPVVARESALDELVGGAGDLGRRYTAKLPELIARSVAEADKKLDPGPGLGGASGKEEGVSFNRRFHMKDGTVSWNPRKRHPDIVKPAGPIDPDVGVVYFDTPKGAPLATYVNFALHPDTVGGEGVSADYPGVAGEAAGGLQGPDMVTVFANGCCGNINHRDVAWADPQKGPHEAQRIGTALAGAVLQDLSPAQAGRARARSGCKARSSSCRSPPVTAEDVARAKEVVKRVNEPKTTFLDKVKAFQVLDVAARDGKPWEVEVQVIALGDQVAWVSLPGEIFVELGLAIKKALAVPAHADRRAGQRLDRLHPGQAGVPAGQLRGGQRPLRRGLGRDAGRGGAQATQVVRGGLRVGERGQSNGFRLRLGFPRAPLRSVVTPHFPSVNRPYFFSTSEAVVRQRR